MCLPPYHYNSSPLHHANMQIVSSGESSDNDSDHQVKKQEQGENSTGRLGKAGSSTTSAHDSVLGTKPSISNEAERSAEFTKYIMQRATVEFADDLNSIRSADDFKGADSLPILVNALQQGTSTFTAEEQLRVVSAK